MDVQQKHNRDRVFSILNDNDSPSFVIHQKQTQRSPPPQRLPSIKTLTPTLERPPIFRQAHYQRNSSLSSVGSPPLLRFDSTSSKSSNSSMDSSPSPTTPAYNYNDATALPYDNLLRQDLSLGYLPSPTSITPFLESSLMIGPSSSGPLPTFEPKAATSMAPMYPAMPIAHADPQQLPTPTLTNHASVSSSSSLNTKPSPPTNHASSQVSPKKNKYPCPYAASHNCLATFTTSGHAARHGKKHTGEKGVHCPVCNKAFTRKDNMKQHERTHKNVKRTTASDETRSKAALTRDAQKSGHIRTVSMGSSQLQGTSIAQSPVSEVASLGQATTDTSLNPSEPLLYQDPSPPLLMVADPALSADVLAPTSLYPPIGDDAMISGVNLAGPDVLDGTIPKPPTLIRGFSDLDTLAQVAESFDPYYQNQF